MMRHSLVTPARRNERGSVDVAALQPDLSASLERVRAFRRRKRLAGGFPLTEGQSLFLVDALALTAVAVWTEAWVVALLFAVAGPVWRAHSLYTRRFSVSVLDDLAGLCAGVSAAAGPALLVSLLLLDTGPGTCLVTLVAFCAAVVLARSVAYPVLLRLRRSGRISYPALVVGASPVAVALAKRISNHPETGLRAVGFVDKAGPARALPAPLLGSASDLPRLVRELQVTDVVVGYGRMPTADLVTILRECDRLDVEIHVLPRLFEMYRLTGDCDHVWGMPLMRVRRLAHRAFSWRGKRLLDVVVAATALILLLPVLVLTAFAVRVELGPGVFFKQVRVGLDGRLFTVRKFRSMRSLEPGVESPWSVTSGDRLGRVGRFIRRYSLDELPQLFNVLCGEMSLVGPRPERPEYVARFSTEIARYGDRHRVPTGLTGLAAVHGLRGDTSIEERAYFDNLYIENWSLSLDLKILARTALSVVRGTGG